MKISKLCDPIELFLTVGRSARPAPRAAPARPAPGKQYKNILNFVKTVYSFKKIHFLLSKQDIDIFFS